MIAIIDYGMGNLRSVQKALEKAGAGAVITSASLEIQKAQKIVLPGVGAMRPAMEKLSSLNLIPAIKDSIAAGKPFLGICLGLQLLFEKGLEGGEVKGLGILKGRVERFAPLEKATDKKFFKIPHMGWNQLQIQKKDCPILKGIKDSADVYFCHSYFVNPQDKSVIAATTAYAQEFASCTWQKNIFGVQFHPEKSQDAGLEILRNFVRI